MPRPPVLCCLALAVGLACGASNEYVEPPPPTVTVANPVLRPVVDYLELTGTTHAINKVEIRARIRGYLQTAHFEEGAYVEEGDLLLVIEPDEYAARVQRAIASLDVARTSKALADATLKRMEVAYKSRAISEVELDESRAQADSAGARVEEAEAVLNEAQLDFSYTTIHAPIAGRVGRREVDPGNLVGASEATLLTTIIQYDPIYAYFDISERNLLAIFGATEEERSRRDRLQRMPTIPLQLGRANDAGYPFEGELDFSEQAVDQATGTFMMRGVFPNPQPLQLLPGLFIRVRLALDAPQDAMLVPDAAVGADQSGKFLLVVDADDVVQRRNVELGTLDNGMRVVRSGIDTDDLVVVNGLLRARPGARVNAVREGADPGTAAVPAESARGDAEPEDGASG